MKACFTILIFIFLTSGSELSKADGFRESVISGYKSSCIEDRSRRGQKTESVKEICDCESSVLNENFSTFEFLLAGAKMKMDKRMLSKEAIQDFRLKLKSCNKKPD
ncbi:MAG: hypothetical protein Q9M92_09805 [Enterobacterales bacterium]|nr:hypothetical protein [Enterobacterales bacterium]